MAKFTVSGFYDEVSPMLNDQISLLKELKETYMCPRTINKKNIADYTYEEFEKEIYPILQENGIKFSSIGSPIGKITIGDTEAFEKQKKQLVELIKIAKLMECNYIRMFSFYYKNNKPEDVYPQVLAWTKEFLKIAKGSGVKLLHENEKEIYGDIPERVLQLYKDINDPDFVLCFDASNYVQCGVDTIKAFDMLKDYTVYYHIKDCYKYKVEVPLGLGIGHYDYIFKELKERKYEGFLTLEPHIVFTYIPNKEKAYKPFGFIKHSKEYKTFKYIDKMLNLSKDEGMTEKFAFVYQYNKVKEMIK